jgi:hypothetical protein
MEGDFVLKIDGKPEQTLKVGDSYQTLPQEPMTLARCPVTNCSTPG